MTKVIIHIGSHRTGTTLLQSVLATNRNALRQRGVYYPETFRFMGDKSSTVLSTNAHFEIPKALAMFSQRDRDDLSRFRQHLLDVRGDFSQIILSAETFYRMLPNKANLMREAGDLPRNTRDLRSIIFSRLADFLHGFDAEIVAYFRRPDSFAESMYTEGIVNGKSTRSFEEFKSFQKFRFDYGAQLATFKQFLPTRALVFEERAAGNLIGNMFADFDIGAPFPQDTTMERRSVPKPATLWLRRCKLAPKTTKRGFNQRKLFAYLPQHAIYFGGDRKFGFWRSLQERDAFSKHALRDTPQLQFPAAPIPLPQVCEWSDADQRLAENAFRAWRERERSWIKERRKKRIKPFMIGQ